MPYGRKLTDEEISQRLIRLQNLERLHTKQLTVNTELRTENRQLKTQMADMADRFEALFQKQQIRIAELEKMVFGARPTVLSPQAPGSNDQSGAGASGAAPLKQRRSAASFRRPLPKPEDVTATTDHPVAGCAS